MPTPSLRYLCCHAQRYRKAEEEATRRAQHAARVGAEADVVRGRADATIAAQAKAVTDAEARHDGEQRAAYEERELGNPLRRVLMKDIMPAVTKALIKLCAERPEEPIVFLGEFLKKEQPVTEA